jgi:hypothetical protein
LTLNIPGQVQDRIDSRTGLHQYRDVNNSYATSNKPRNIATVATGENTTNNKGQQAKSRRTTRSRIQGEHKAFTTTDSHQCHISKGVLCCLPHKHVCISPCNLLLAFHHHVICLLFHDMLLTLWCSVALCCLLSFCFSCYCFRLCCCLPSDALLFTFLFCSQSTCCCCLPSCFSSSQLDVVVVLFRGLMCAVGGKQQSPVLSASASASTSTSLSILLKTRYFGMRICLCSVVYLLVFPVVVS